MDENILSTETYSCRIATGDTIAGRFTLVTKIGEGGMGEVWIAQQAEPVKRKVAVKFIKAGMDSRAVVARFEVERQALAMMDHPNIARIFDGGIGPDGNPFFAMELVEDYRSWNSVTASELILGSVLRFSSRSARPCSMRIKRE